jgi:hypothetical protein
MLKDTPISPLGVELVENFDYYRVAPVKGIRGLPPQKIEQSQKLATDVRDSLPPR